MCASCVDRLFGSGPGTCPVANCSARLRAAKFRTQTFDDISVEREVDIRKRVNKVFNRRQEEFSTPREWDDYLEMVEATTFEIVNGTAKEKARAEARLAEYEELNRALIERNMQRERAEALAFMAREEAEKEVLVAARQAAVLETEEEKRETLMSRRAQLEAMAKGDLAAVERIKAAHAKRAEERRKQARLDVAAAKGVRQGRELAMKSMLARAGKVVEEEEEEEVWEPLGKGVDDTEAYYRLLDRYPRYEWVDKFVEQADVAAGGYRREEFYQRALHEAFSGLTVFLDGEEEEERRAKRDRTDVMFVDPVS